MTYCITEGRGFLYPAVNVRELEVQDLYVSNQYGLQ